VLLRLALPDVVGLADFVIARVVVVNDGDRPLTVSRRFHLHEGDLSVLIDDVAHHGAEQIDSEERSIELPPGAAFGSGVMLAASDRGLLFAAPGSHRLAVRLRTATTGDVLSDASTVTVLDRPPRLEPEEAFAVSGGQLEPDALGRLVDAPLALRLMSAASAVRSGGWASMDLQAAASVLRFELGHVPPGDLGWLVTGLLPPAHDADDPLLAAAREHAPSGSRARSLIDGTPFDAGDR
jgi:urease beta subunit